MAMLAFSYGDLADLALAIFLIAVGVGGRLGVLASGRNVRPALVVDQGRRA